MLPTVSAKVAERPRNCLQSNTNPVRLRTLAFVEVLNIGYLMGILPTEIMGLQIRLF
jgi:hypothetical protein